MYVHESPEVAFNPKETLFWFRKSIVEIGNSDAQEYLRLIKNKS